MEGFGCPGQSIVTHLVRILGVDVIFDGDKTLFAKVFGCNLHQVGNFRLSWD